MESRVSSTSTWALSSTKLDLLWQILNETTIPIRHMYPTHMSSRGDALTAEAIKWLQAGGVCDLTADIEELNETSTVDALNKFRKEALPLKQITNIQRCIRVRILQHFLRDFIFDFRSIPEYDASGQLIAYGMAPPDLSLKTIQNLVFET